MDFPTTFLGGVVFYFALFYLLEKNYPEIYSGTFSNNFPNPHVLIKGIKRYFNKDPKRKKIQ